MVNWFVVDRGQHLDSFLAFSMVEKPTWRLGYTKYHKDDPESKDSLESEGPAPRERASDEAEGKVPPVGERDADADKHDLCGNETTSLSTFAKL